ncbi:rhodanese-like domain-containing protein [Acidovorax sp. MR-S7]|uniref:rhodanese-like domain-containing protein n=1 Tax=Acidovorax sp. MR-S7 TaxID=1268622 RepID=UPI00037D9354|nr:rhodanese-like domain-containing protein [Acidovorax sp. MR-S7]GAD22103.1 rhodanese-related sulfurtransferase [Acidovorax sp. MR-S7]
MKTALDLVAAAKARIQEIPVDAAEAAIAQADVLIDVREPDEYRQGHLPGAINLPRGVLEFQMSSQSAMEPRGLRIVLYCKTSGRAALAACALQDMGYLDVRSVAGGFDAWKAAGKAVAVPVAPVFG